MMSRGSGDAVTRGLLLAALCLMVAVGAAVAADGACEEACQDQYAEDSAACQEAYQEAIAEAQARRDQCMEDATSYFEKLRCITDYELDKERANLDLIRCENDAQIAFARCLNSCQASPSDP